MRLMIIIITKLVLASINIFEVMVQGRFRLERE